MKFSIVVSTVSLAACASAHTTVFGVWINNVFMGDGRNVYVRSPPNNNPVKDLQSSAVACNVNNRNVPTTLCVKSGDKFTFEWHHDVRNDDIIASSHKGPVVVYIAPTSSNGAGNVWVPIYKENQPGVGQPWPVDKLITAKGQHSITIPNIAAGDYLLRAELITLHEANVAYNTNSARGVQLYPSCTQIRVVSSGGTSLPGGVAFPGAYTYSDPGLVYDLYRLPQPLTYTVPGPSVWSGAAGGSIGLVGQPGSNSPPSGGYPSCAAVGGGTGTTSRSTQTQTAGGSGQTAYGQCGGQGWTGPTSCVSGYKCQVSNAYYSQCVPG